MIILVELLIILVELLALVLPYPQLTFSLALIHTHVHIYSEGFWGVGYFVVKHLVTPLFQCAA